MKRVKKILSCLLAVCILIYLPVTAYASEQSNNIISDSKAKIEYGEVSEYGLQRAEFISDRPRTAPNIGSNTHTAGTIPQSYNSNTAGYITPVKNQWVFGTCWAFAAVSCAEATMIKNGGSVLSSTDYSEDHLTWFAFHKSSLLGDGMTLDYSNLDNRSGYNVGASWRTSTAVLATGTGLELEENAPYSTEDVSSHGNYPESQRFSSYARLKNSYYLAADQAESIQNMSIIKSYIMDYGAIDASYYAPQTTDEYIKYFDENSYYYYQHDFTAANANHEITVVGWDDSIDITNFSSGSRPTKPGAWLIKNSHGTDLYDNGYMWISYYDTSMCDFVAYDVVNADTVDHIYQHDGYYPNDPKCVEKNGGIYKMANVFTAGGSESLDAVSFWTYENNVSYTITIYKDLTSSANPSSGVLCAQGTQTKVHGVAAICGYITVDLNVPVALSSGEKFSVVIELKNSDGSPTFLPLEGESQNIGYGTVEYSSNSGESFYYYKDAWCDCSKTTIDFSTGNNLAIKAFTTNSNNITFDANGGTVKTSSAISKKGSPVTLPTPERTESIIYNANGGKNAPSEQSVSIPCLGWAKSQTASTQDYACGSAFSPDSDMTLYAIWGKANATVSSNSPSRNGYIFKGWSESRNAATADYQPGNNILCGSATTLYAVWERDASAMPSISVSNNSFVLGAGSVQKIYVSSEQNGYDGSVKLVAQSSDTSILKTGLTNSSIVFGAPTELSLTAVGNGKCTVTFNLVDVSSGETLDTYSIEATVVGASASYSIKYKDNVKFTVPDNFQPVRYESVSTKIATVNANGIITGAGSGTTCIMAVDAMGNTRTATVNVTITWWQWIIRIVLFGWIWY